MIMSGYARTTPISRAAAAVSTVSAYTGLLCQLLPEPRMLDVQLYDTCSLLHRLSMSSACAHLALVRAVAHACSHAHRGTAACSSAEHLAAAVQPARSKQLPRTTPRPVDKQHPHCAWAVTSAATHQHQLLLAAGRGTWCTQQQCNLEPRQVPSRVPQAAPEGLSACRCPALLVLHQ
jgi:hypothetical protein